MALANTGRDINKTHGSQKPWDRTPIKHMALTKHGTRHQ